jgi:hypothetical protein
MVRVDGVGCARVGVGLANGVGRRAASALTVLEDEEANGGDMWLLEGLSILGPGGG